MVPALQKPLTVIGLSYFLLQGSAVLAFKVITLISGFNA